MRISARSEAFQKCSEAHLSDDGRVGQPGLPSGSDLFDATFVGTKPLDELFLTVERSDLSCGEQEHERNSKRKVRAARARY